MDLAEFCAIYYDIIITIYCIIDDDGIGYEYFFESLEKAFSVSFCLIWLAVTFIMT